MSRALSIIGERKRLLRNLEDVSILAEIQPGLRGYYSPNRYGASSAPVVYAECSGASELIGNGWFFVGNNYIHVVNKSLNMYLNKDIVFSVDLSSDYASLFIGLFLECGVVSRTGGAQQGVVSPVNRNQQRESLYGIMIVKAILENRRYFTDTNDTNDIDFIKCISRGDCHYLRGPWERVLVGQFDDTGFNLRFRQNIYLTINEYITSHGMKFTCDYIWDLVKSTRTSAVGALREMGVPFPELMFAYRHRLPSSQSETIQLFDQFEVLYDRDKTLIERIRGGKARDGSILRGFSPASFRFPGAFDACLNNLRDFSLFI